jgi:hypothetical protein
MRRVSTLAWVDFQQLRALRHYQKIRKFPVCEFKFPCSLQKFPCSVAWGNCALTP